MAQENDAQVPITSGTNGTSWCSWTRTSAMMLRAVEKRILSCMKTPYRGSFVDIGPAVGDAGDKIWTISMNETSTQMPLVMMHGLGAGLALWCLNLDSLAATRSVYAIDLLGFGRSTRPSFSRDASKAEEQFVKSIEEWRKEMNLDQFILLGHSLGGYLAAAYALKYPNRVHHLILADPWGFVERPENWREKYQIPFWVRAVVTAARPLNPLWALRAAGPAGPWLIEKVRPDIIRKFTAYMTDVPDVNKLIAMYIHQCNAQSPSGESAFHAMMSSFGWAQNPMGKRLPNLDPNIPITLIMGSRSWIDSPSDALKSAGTAFVSENDSGGKLSPVDIEQSPEIKPSRACHTEIKVINGAGHHVYLDKPEIFNKFVNEACEMADAQIIRKSPTVSDTIKVGSNSDSESTQNNS